MFTRPPDLPDSTLAAALHSGWSLTAEEIAYAPVGFGSHHWRVTAAGQRWFVTVDELGAGSNDEDDLAVRLSAALRTARLLRDLGMAFVVAPVATSTGDVLVPVGDRHLAALYPHIEGVAYGWGPFNDPAARRAVLDRLVVMHTAPAVARRHTLLDNFAISSRASMNEALGDRLWDGGPFGEQARRLLGERAGHIAELFARYDRLAAYVASRPGRFVITHGEPHRGNTMTTADGVVLVDWDTTLIAPPERDLWWLTSGDAAIAGEYQSRTGTAVDDQALELYTLRWDLSDLAIYAAQFHAAHGDTEDTQAAWSAFVAYLDRIQA